MQVRAIFKVATNVSVKRIKALSEIEIPIVKNIKEYNLLSELVHRVASETRTRKRSRFN